MQKKSYTKEVLKTEIKNGLIKFIPHLSYFGPLKTL